MNGRERLGRSDADNGRSRTLICHRILSSGEEDQEVTIRGEAIKEIVDEEDGFYHTIRMRTDGSNACMPMYRIASHLISSYHRYCG